MSEARIKSIWSFAIRQRYSENQHLAAKLSNYYLLTKIASHDTTASEMNIFQSSTHQKLLTLMFSRDVIYITYLN